jgi:hypothetical protein
MLVRKSLPGGAKNSRPACQKLAGSTTNSVRDKQFLHPNTTTINAIMWELIPSPPVCDIRHRSETLLATCDRVPPSTLPASLLEHPIWKRLAAHEGTAYDRVCKVADAHRYTRDLQIDRAKADLSCRARLERMQAASREEKSSLVFDGFLPVKVLCVYRSSNGKQQI